MGKVIRLFGSPASKRLRLFRQAYFDYLDGEREDPPVLELLDEADQRRARSWISSLDACRGIDPYSKPPSVADIMERLFRDR